MKDRHERDFIIQPTSEEVITDIARQELRSYRALPKNFYHIQTKFRDERRPRFGVMRGREFTMKDAYSFDRDVECGGPQLRADVRGLRAHLRAARADLPRRGGRHRRHRRRPLARVPGDCRHRRRRDRLLPGFGLRRQHRTRRGPGADRRRARAGTQSLHKTPTPGKSTCEDVAALLGLPLQRTVKSLVLATDETQRRPAICCAPPCGCCSCAVTTSSTK